MKRTSVNLEMTAAEWNAIILLARSAKPNDVVRDFDIDPKLAAKVSKTLADNLSTLLIATHITITEPVGSGA